MEDKPDVVERISIVLTVLNAIVLVASVGGSLVVRRKFVDVFTDFDAELPAATAMFVNAPWMAWLAATVILLAALAAKEFITRKWIPLWLNLAFIALAVAYWVVFFIAMMLPLVTIGTHLTK